MTAEEFRRIKTLSAPSAISDLTRSMRELKDRFRPAVSHFERLDWLRESYTDLFPIKAAVMDLHAAVDFESPISKTLKIFQSNPFIGTSNFKPVIDTVSAISYKSILDQIAPTYNTHNLFYSQEIDLLEDVEAEQKANPEKSSEKTNDLILTQFDAVKEMIAAIYLNSQELYRLDPRRFEEMIAELLRNDGYIVELTKQTRDGGYDIMALAPMKGLQPVKMLVECKRYKEDRPVDVSIIRSFRDVIQDNGHRGLIVTTSYVTKDAKDRANLNKTPYYLEFKERNDIINWVADYLGKPLI